MSDVPEVVMREMLSRVAVEPLLRSRSVNKEWRGIIDDPAFSQLHSDKKMGGDSIFIRTDDGEIYYFPFDTLNFSKSGTRHIFATSIKKFIADKDVLLPFIKSTLPVPHCNGSLLVSMVGVEIWTLWNPFDGSWLVLQSCIDSAINVVCCGLAYDVASDDYKIVRVARVDDGGQPEPQFAYRTSIYSTKLGIWRRVEDFPSCGGRRLLRSSRDRIVVLPSRPTPHGVFLNNALHWIAMLVEPGIFTACIVVLDLVTETYREIELPPASFQGWRHRIKSTRLLNAVGGSLFLSCMSRGRIDNAPGSELDFFNLWVWEKCGEEYKWTELISMQQKSNSILYPCYLRPIAYMKQKQQVLLQCRNSEFMWFDVEKNKCISTVSLNVSQKRKKVSRNGIEGRFSCQVLPTSLFWLNGSSDDDKSIASNGSLPSLTGSSDADQSIASNGSRKSRKRCAKKWTRTIDRLIWITSTRKSSLEGRTWSVLSLFPFGECQCSFIHSFTGKHFLAGKLVDFGRRNVYDEFLYFVSLLPVFVFILF